MPNILGTVNSRTSLTTILQMVETDFGIIISRYTAQGIREAARKGCLVWDATKIVTTDSRQIRIARTEDGRIEANVEYKTAY